MKNNLSTDEAFVLAKKSLAEGKSFATIRKELTAMGLEDSTIKYIIRQLDDELLKMSKKTGAAGYAKRKMISGAIIMLMGTAVAIYTWIEKIQEMNYYLLEFGALFVGYYFFRSGYMQSKKQNSR
ncbi:hypothetical protein QQ020_20990 [Fulvivirgaceae bacterium BMA12]|uniref:Uncharacterized protein n=1 Tax=Agaribacillus aureus TaxID=3051825 RepID=A0ABT8L9Y5_9BACT|nr:hypothetical protein [Fulvivirgaceae bacterium BMA12]